MAQYPSGDPTFTVKANGASVEAAHVNALQDEITALGSALRGTLAHDVKVTTAKRFFEQGRAVANGKRTAVAFNAGNFTGNGLMTWTVAAGDQAIFSYSQSGDLVTVSFVINTTTVGGTPSTILQIAIPGGFTAIEEARAAFTFADNSTPGTGVAVASGTTIGLYKDLTAANAWSAAANTTSVQGQISFWTA